MKKDNFTPIHNYVVEAMARFNFSPYETRILFALFRKTYGWGKKGDQISLTQFAEMTGLDTTHVSRTIRRMKQRGLLISQYPGHYAFNKKTVINRYTPPPAEALPAEALPAEAVPPPACGGSNNRNDIKEIKNIHEPSKSAEKGPETSPGQPDTQEQGQKPATGQRRAKKRQEIDILASALIDYLNEKAGTRYQHTYPNLKFISARLQEPGITYKICRTVIDIKVADWKDDGNMRKYLRPETLFNETKFAQYAGIAMAKLDPPKPPPQAPDPMHVKRLQELDRDPTPEEMEKSGKFLDKIRINNPIKEHKT